MRLARMKPRGFAPPTAYLSKFQDMEQQVSVMTLMEPCTAPGITAERREKMARLFDGMTGIAEADIDTVRKTGQLLAKDRKDYG